MAVTPYAFELTDLATAKEHLDIMVSNTDFDDIVQRFINASSVKIENMTDRLLMQRTGIEEYHSGFGNDNFLLNQWPALKPTEVWVDCNSVFTDTELKLDTSEYELELSSRGTGIGVMLLKGRVFPKGYRNLKVVYDAGYATVPDDLENACLWMVEYMYEMRDDRRVGTSQKGKNAENISFLGNIPEFVMDIINSYKRCEFGTSMHQGIRTT